MLCGWLHALPETLILAHPSLGLLYALALLYTNHWQEASARLLAIEREVGPGERTRRKNGICWFRWLAVGACWLVSRAIWRAKWP
jgi:ATP/maltotriose-dependent transcriptional regulator MalT